MSDEAQDLNKGIAANIRRLMSERDISVDDLVRRSEISKPEIELILAGRVEPTARDLLRLAGALNARVSQFLERLSWESDGEGGGAIRLREDEDG